jgi:hypothetical protein
MATPVPSSIELSRSLSEPSESWRKRGEGDAAYFGGSLQIHQEKQRKQMLSRLLLFLWQIPIHLII